MFDLNEFENANNFTKEELPELNEEDTFTEELPELNEYNNFHNDDDYEESFEEQENREKNLSNIDSVPLDNKARNFISEKIKEGKSVTATTIVKEKPTFTLKKEFVIGFTENWFNLVQKVGLTSVESKVVYYLIDKMEFGNLIAIKQSAIAKAIDMPTSNLSRCFKSLLDKHILVKDAEGNTYVNSNLFSKGLSTRMAKEKYDNLKKAQKTTNLIEEAF